MWEVRRRDPQGPSQNLQGDNGSYWGMSHEAAALPEHFLAAGGWRDIYFSDIATGRRPTLLQTNSHPGLCKQ